MTSAPGAPAEAAITFHLARRYTVSALGRVAIVAGVGVVAVVATAAMAPGTVRTLALALAWVVAVVGVALTLVAAVRTLRPPVLLSLDEHGVRVRVRRGGSVGSIPWSQVHAVRREPRSAGTWVVIARTDGRTAAVPERLVAEGGAALATALRDRLDRAHGQRRIGRDARAGDGGGGGI